MAQDVTTAPQTAIAERPDNFQQEIERALQQDSLDTLKASQGVIEYAKQWHKKLKDRWQPASDEDRDAVFNVLAAQPWKTPDALRADRDTFFMVYHADLHDIPSEALAEAAKKARLTLKWFPTTGQLREFAFECEAWREFLRKREGVRRLAHAESTDGIYASEQQWADLMARLRKSVDAEDREGL